MNNIFLNVALIQCHNSQTLNKIFHISFFFIICCFYQIVKIRQASLGEGETSDPYIYLFCFHIKHLNPI